MIDDRDLVAAQRRLRVAGPADRLDAQRALCAAIARTHGFTIVERTTMPAGAAAFFDWRTNTATVPLIVDDVTFAIRLHELGHGACGPCPNTPPHFRDPRVSDWWDCGQCEPDAWQAARRWVPFTPAMFHRLQASLRHYLRSTRAYPAAIAAAERAVNFTESYARPLQRKVEQQLFCERALESARPQSVRDDEEIQRQRTLRARQIARRIM